MNAMKEVLLEMLRVQYAPNAPKGHRSILYMIILNKGHKALCPLCFVKTILLAPVTNATVFYTAFHCSPLMRALAGAAAAAVAAE